MPEDRSSKAQPTSDAASRLRLFRERVLGDERLQSELSQPLDPHAFVDLAMAVARQAGIDLGRDQLLASTRPDPLGVSRWLPAGEPMAGWPGADWLPTHVSLAPQPCVDWAHLGGA